MRRATALRTAALLLLLCRAAFAGDCGDWQASLDQHNSYRAIHGVPSLTWSSSLADGSRSWSQQLAASGCSLQHSGGNYGENLYAMYGSANPGCVTAVQGWYSEIKNYRFTSTPWSDNTFSQIGHFSQVVWKGTTQVGCAAATGSNCWVVTCRYSPPGNYIGDSSFFANVLPPNSNPVSPTPPPVFPSPQPSPLPPSPQPSPVWPSPQPSPVWPSPMPDPSPMPTPSPQPNPSPPQPLPSPLLKSPAPLPSPKPKKSPKPLPLPSPYRRTPSPAPEPSPMPQPSPWVDPSPQPPPPCEDMFRQCWRYARFCAPRYYFARIRRPVRDVCPQTCNNCPVQVSGVIYLTAPEE